MSTAKEILDEINEDEDWYRNKETGKPIKILVRLSCIIDDSSKLKPAINIRSLNPEKIDTIKDDILSNRNVVTTAWAMRLGKSFCIIDGNHKQAAVKKLCKELGDDDCKNKKYGFDKIELQVLRGDPTNTKDAWGAFCISYRINRDATTVEKILAIGYGWEHHGEHDRYLSNLERDFDESKDSLRRHKQAYILLMGLDPEDYEVFMDKYKYKRWGIRSASKKLQEISEDSNNKIGNSNKDQQEKGDALIGTIVNDAKLGDEILNSVINNISFQFDQNVKISKLRESIREATEQINREGVVRNINILSNRYYSPMKGGLKELEGLEDLESKDLPVKLIENIKGYHREMHKLMMASKNKQMSE